MADIERVEKGNGAARTRRQRRVHAPLAGGADTGVPAGYLGVSAPAMRAPRWRRRLFIERRGDLSALIDDLRHARLMAIDAEFTQARVRTPDEPSHRLALLQIAIDNDHQVSYIVDPLRVADLSPLQEVMENASTLKLFHGVGADARVLATRGLVPANILDLEAVSRSLFGQRESSLQAMLQRAYDIRLDKSLQRSDWSRRPLTTAMVAYAARDAEMTLALYAWLNEHYSWALDLHRAPAEEPVPDVASWILPYLDGARPRPAVLAVTEAGLADDRAAQVVAVHRALSAIKRPSQLARVIRLGVDLELTELTPDLRRFLAFPAADVRAGTARALGRLHDTGAEPLLRPLLDDPVQDVREAAQAALRLLSGPPPTPRVLRPRSGANGAVRWTSSATDDAPSPDDWRAALRSRFSGSSTTGGDDTPSE